MELYEYLQDKNLATEEQIDERVEKIQSAMFWIKKTTALEDD